MKRPREEGPPAVRLPAAHVRHPDPGPDIGGDIGLPAELRAREAELRLPPGPVLTRRIRKALSEMALKYKALVSPG